LQKGWSCESPEPRDHRDQIASARKHPRAEREREEKQESQSLWLKLKGDSDYIRAVLFVGGPGEEKAEARSGKKQNFESVSRLLSNRIFASQQVPL
jgi:hypothetical protein